MSPLTMNTKQILFAAQLDYSRFPQARLASA